ncbi:hypothetical protein F4808DRAFT_22269 [Astrocystis sublimbata]|nr:hypothetical protein F4808DRAFT_22269 [Astrocystis sublimbata]
MAEKRSRDEFSKGDEGGNSPRGRGRRSTRALGMTDVEWASRERRRIRFQALRRQWGEGDGEGEAVGDNKVSQGGHADTVEEAAASAPLQPPAVQAADQDKKPWESLVVGNVGENLSHIERMNREIEQQRYIVHYHESNSPDQVEHNKRILDKLISERAGMEDNEENNMPQDQREKEERISDRLEVLQWALESSQCDDERVNIMAAIQGYASGDIPFSLDFTLIYGGHIVDRCPTYGSFCADRSERLDRYFEEHGPGWLWQEPPLAGPGTRVRGKKGLCLERESTPASYGVGNYWVSQEFAISRNKVGRPGKPVYPQTSLTVGSKTAKMSPWGSQRRHDAEIQLLTLLDSGATFPIIHKSDLARLNMDLKRYPAQGVQNISTVGGNEMCRYFEMYVSVCFDEGTSLVGDGKKAVWPGEPRTLGGFYPVLIQKDPPQKATPERLSGMVAFEACYISSAPSMRQVWLGEDRRDVLGTSRFPAHMRFDSDKRFIIEYPEEIEDLRRGAQTPDRVVFVHESPQNHGAVLMDSDCRGRGKSEIAVGHLGTEVDRDGKTLPSKASPQQVVRIEPRKGGVKIVPQDDPRAWIKAEESKRRKTGSSI